MKRTIEEMACAARQMTRKKYEKLSAKKKHELLAALALDTLSGRGTFSDFVARYKVLQAWAPMDCYTPPGWLKAPEALQEYASFHNRFTPTPVAAQSRTMPSESGPLNWAWRFDVTVVMDQVVNPYNVGSLLRLMDNFGFRELVHATPTLSLDHPHLKKASRGCDNWIPITYRADLVSFLRESEHPVIGLETGDQAVSLLNWEPPLPCTIVLGNETYGISSEIRDACHAFVRIPMAGFKASMNVTHAFAVLAYCISESGTILSPPLT